MLSNLLTAECHVPVNGYRWLCHRGDFQLLAAAGEFRTYDVFTDEPALHRVLAKLECDRESFLDFANRHGSIGATEKEWAKHVNAMRDAIALYEALKVGDKKALAELLNVYGDEHPTISGPLVNLIHSDVGSSLRFCHVRPDGQQAAFAWNNTIDRSRWLLDAVISAMAINLAVDIRRAENGATVVKLRAQNLAAALWTQFAVAVSEDTEFPACKECGIPIALSVHRSDAKYCSEACTMAAYRKRKNRAVAMHAAGATLRTIAKEVGSNLETVKKWIQPKGETNAKKKKGTRRR